MSRETIVHYDFGRYLDVSPDYLQLLGHRGVPASVVAQIRAGVGLGRVSFQGFEAKLAQALPGDDRTEQRRQVFRASHGIYGGPVIGLPGVYRVSAKVVMGVGAADRLVTMDSPAVTFVVAEPEGVDAAALPHFRRALVAGPGLLLRRADGVGWVAALRTVVRDYPGSRYAVYARWALAMAEHRRVERAGLDDSKTAAARRSIIELLEPVAKQEEANAIVIDAWRVLLEVLASREIRGEARSYLERLASAKTDEPEVLRARATLEHWRRREQAKASYARLAAQTQEDSATLEQRILFDFHPKNWVPTTMARVVDQARKDPSVRSVLSRLLADKGRPTEVRGKALACLIRCGAKDLALPTCVEVVRARHTPLLEVAAAGLGQIGDRAATPILKQLLDEMAEKEQLTCEYLVVVNAMEALARLEGDAAAATIRPFATGRWARSVARDAQRVLDRLDDRRDG